MNPRASCPTYTLSRGASSPLEYFSKVKMFFVIIFSIRGGFRSSALNRVWRREWDSNPRGLAPKRFSRPPRYDRFDISPYTLNRKCFYILPFFCKAPPRYVRLAVPESLLRFLLGNLFPFDRCALQPSLIPPQAALGLHSASISLRIQSAI